ncbi:MAG: hypothetical protein OXH49_11325 [Gemmatimonadetes bacterium]|nr:hypothetical protein [Gemmatimonadota bacterium]
MDSMELQLEKLEHGLAKLENKRLRMERMASGKTPRPAPTDPTPTDPRPGGILDNLDEVLAPVPATPVESRHGPVLGSSGGDVDKFLERTQGGDK